MRRGIDGGVADPIGDAGGISAVVFRGDKTVGGEDTDARNIEAEHLRDTLCQDSAGSLTNLRCTGQNRQAAIKIELDIYRGMRFAGPVDWFGSAANIV